MSDRRQALKHAAHAVDAARASGVGLSTRAVPLSHFQRAKDLSRRPCWTRRHCRHGVGEADSGPIVKPDALTEDNLARGRSKERHEISGSRPWDGCSL